LPIKRVWLTRLQQNGKIGLFVKNGLKKIILIKKKFLGKIFHIVSN
jgi:hypothetical protein